MTKDGKKYNILLISMSLLPRNPEESYYAYESKFNCFYFRGISQMEAGTKYFLRLLQSRGEKLDKIIIVESYEARGRINDVTGLIEPNDEVNETAIRLSSVEFYKERILQYISGKEVPHIPIYTPGDKLTEEDCNKQNENINSLQIQLNSYEGMNKDIPLDYTEEEIKNLFKDVKLEDKDQNGTSKAIFDTIKEICDIVDDFCPAVLYTDMQGARRNETYIINAALKMLGLRGVKVKASVAIDFEGGKNRNGGFNYIIDTTVNDRILDMVSGMKEFQTTGRGDTLIDFWENKNDKNGLPGVSKDEAIREANVIDQIKEISDAISLCYVDKFEDGLRNFKNAVKAYETADQEDVHPLFQTFVRDLNDDYNKAGLLDEQIEVKNAVEWCLKKQLYQQALTIIEADIPREAYKHIYYKNTESEFLAYFLKFAYTHSYIKKPGTDDYQYKETIDNGDNESTNKWFGGKKQIPPKYLFDRNSFIPNHPEYVWMNHAIFWGKNKSKLFKLKLFSEQWSDVHNSGQEEIPDKIFRFLREYHNIKILRNGINHANPQEVFDKFFDSYRKNHKVTTDESRTKILQGIIKDRIKAFFKAYKGIRDINIDLYEFYPIEDNILDLINKEQHKLAGA